MIKKLKIILLHPRFTQNVLTCTTKGLVCLPGYFITSTGCKPCAGGASTCTGVGIFNGGQSIACFNGFTLIKVNNNNINNYLNS